jgi:glycosyltransferase involved in cell wall biosynthesis
MSRRIAMLVSNACAPDRRVLREAGALVARGHGVTVLAWDRERRYPPQEEMSGVKIERIGVESVYGAGLRRLRQWPAFARQASACLRQCAWDAVHCHDLDTWPIGYAFARRRHIPLLLDAHESYPDLLAPHLPGPAVSVLRMMDRFLVRRADALITVGELLGDHYRRWAQRVVVVRNCPPAVVKASGSGPLRQKWGLEDVDLVLCYIGGFTHGRVILPLIEAVKADRALGLVLVGDGPQAASLLAAAHGVDRIVYLGQRVAPDQVVTIMRAADVVFYGLRADFPNNRFSSPNALYSALVAGCPLLTTGVGEIARVVQEEACGVILEGPTQEAIAAGLAQLRPPETRAVMAQKAQLAASTKYGWAAAETALLDLYRDLWGEV